MIPFENRPVRFSIFHLLDKGGTKIKKDDMQGKPKTDTTFLCAAIDLSYSDALLNRHITNS